jgi:thiamine biosynthesis lipoprotein
MHRDAASRLPLACLLACAACAAPRLERYEYAEPHMGTTFRLAFYATSEDEANAAAAAAFARIDELDRTLSDYEEGSELSRLGARSDAAAPTEPIALSRDLWRVLERAQQVAARSRGAFDVTVGPVVALWRRARRQGELPDESRIESALASTGFERLELDRESKSARLLAPHMRLDVGAIGKGYALDEALELLRARGVERALVEGGGDVAVSAPPPGRFGWRIALEAMPGAPSATIEVADAAVATSGDAFQALELGAERYSHIVDPRTGRALARRIGATVVARSGALADALATAVCVLGPREGPRFAETFGASVRVVVNDGGRLAISASDAFPPALHSRATRARAPSE